MNSGNLMTIEARVERATAEEFVDCGVRYLSTSRQFRMGQLP